MNAAVEQVQIDAIQRFARSAEAFCTLMETQDALTPRAFVQRCAAALAGLYRDALALPDQVDEACGDADLVRVDAQQVRAKVHEHVKRLDSYLAYFDPYDPNKGMFYGLNDDLGDIYQDVRSGLELYRKGTHCAVNDAVFDWQFSFLTHWGRHLVNALTALHAIIAGNLLADDE